MNVQILQLLQEKFQRRVQNVKRTQPRYFLQAIAKFLNYLESDSIFKTIIKEIPVSEKFLSIEKSNPENNLLSKIDLKVFSEIRSEKELVYFSYKILCKLSESNLQTMLNFARTFDSNEGQNPQIAIGIILNEFFEPFCLFIEEKLSDKKAVLSMLYRYKHRVEWFHRERLLQIYENETNRGEKLLALDLYQYLFDEGVNFTIEPSSIDGAIDLIAAQNSDDPLLADTKVFKGDKTYICKGFGQLYSYTAKYNEPFGYLVIYNVTDKDLSFLFQNTTGNVPFVTHNHKTIFFITIDLYKHTSPPSKRGLINPIEIKEEDLFQFPE